MLDVEALFDRFADAVADRIAKRLSRVSAADVIDQQSSPLGPRRHCAAVRRRMATGDSRASRVGRRFLLTQEALAEELYGTGPGPASAPLAHREATSNRAGAGQAPPSEPSAHVPGRVRAELERELRLLQGGRSPTKRSKKPPSPR